MELKYVYTICVFKICNEKKQRIEKYTRPFFSKIFGCRNIISYLCKITVPQSSLAFCNPNSSSMKKLKFIIIVFITLSVIFLKFNYADNVISKNITTAVKVMDERPEVALKTLDSINPAEIKSEYQFARYALYLTQAKHKNYINEASDSLINIAVNFYDSSPALNPYDRMLAHYYAGVICTNTRKYSDAITNLIEAEHIAESQNQQLWLGHIQAKIAKIYGQVFAFSEAVKYDSLAYETFRSNNDSLNLRYQYLQLANSLNNARRNAESLAISNEILSDAIHRNDTVYIGQAYGLIAHSHHRLKNYTAAADYYNRYIELFPDKTTPKQYWLYIDVLWQSGKHDDALDLIGFVKRKYMDKAEIPFDILYEVGKTDEAYYQLKKVFTETDSILDEIIRQDVHSTVDEYHRNEIKIMELSHQNDVIRLTALIILIIAGGMIISLFISQNQKEQKRKNEQIMSLADELESILNERKCNPTASSPLPAEDGPRFSISRKHLDSIRLLCETYYESNQKESIKSKTAHNVEEEIKDFVNNPDFHAFLEYLANSENQDVMSRFRKQMPGLSDKEYYIFICSALKLPVPVILMFFDLNRNTLYTTRRRMRQKISDANPIDAREFLNHL